MFHRVFLLFLGFGVCLRLANGLDVDGSDSPKLKLLPRYCGLAAVDRLAHGRHARLYEYPWIALLQYDHEGVIEHGCSGSLINNRYVLTAAHCLSSESDQQLLNVRLGEFDKSQYVDCETYDTEQDCAEPADDYGVESVTIHPNYNRKLHRADIGLIRLNRNVTMHDNTSPVCLPITSTLRSSVLPRYTAIGWGTCANRTANSNILRSSMVASVDGVECNRTLSLDQPDRQVDESQICATSFADLDVGAPLGAVMPHPHSGEKYVQLGVASGAATDTCARAEVPGVYTRVANYMEWILDTIHP